VKIWVDIPRKCGIMTILKAILITGVGLYMLKSEHVQGFVQDCLGMSVHYTARKWPELSKKVRATSSKIVEDLYQRAEKKRGDVA